MMNYQTDPIVTLMDIEDIFEQVHDLKGRKHPDLKQLAELEQRSSDLTMLIEEGYFFPSVSKADQGILIEQLEQVGNRVNTVSLS